MYIVVANVGLSDPLWEAIFRCQKNGCISRTYEYSNHKTYSY